jgi:hypothetical protein
MGATGSSGEVICVNGGVDLLSTGARDAPSIDKPVLVLTCARSGSTLLRAFLDRHPDLGCPPETNIAKIVVDLRELWSNLDPECKKAELSLTARSHLRGTIDAVMTDYLKRHGKARYCDKSLGTVEAAEEFLDLYPETKFICLYRHAMDVVSSALEASPWGLFGYGFERYARLSPSNSVGALVAYWNDTTVRTMEFEEKHPDRCIRVHYEELAASPEKVVGEIFKFLEIAQLPDISRSFLVSQGPPENHGHGDHKIRATRKVSTETVGNGLRLPISMIPMPQLAAMNNALSRLGYTQVTREWHLALFPPTLLTKVVASGEPEDADESATADVLDGHVERHPDEEAFTWLDKELAARVKDKNGKHAETFAIVAYSMKEPRAALVWRLDLAHGRIEDDIEGNATLDFAGLDVDWAFSAQAHVWRAVLAGEQNFSGCLRLGSVRYIGREAMAQEPVEPSRGWMERRVDIITDALDLDG